MTEKTDLRVEALPCQRFWQDQTVFLTGSTGFLGIVLVSKIISDAPCTRLLLLVRGGKSRYFDFIRMKLPPEKSDAICQSSKIEVFDGDIEKPNLGLSDEALTKVKATSTVYIHAASSINLQRSLIPISKSVVEPSLAIADIALSSPVMQRFVYVSTAYANAHLHDGTDTKVSEQIYPLRAGGGDSTDMEYSDLSEAGAEPPEFRQNNFPFPYSYAKHLTERLLLKRFEAKNKAQSILIVRPSLMGPALREPYPYFEVPGSSPATGFLAALVPTLSWKISFASRLPDPYNQSTFDEVPIDIVVNRLLMHVSRQSSGIVHAVAGKARRPFSDLWERAMLERKLPWFPRPVWHADVDWRSPSLHPIARFFVIIGTSYDFKAEATDKLWEDMSEAERYVFPLFLQSLEESGSGVLRRAAFTSLIERYLVKKNLPMILLKVLTREPVMVTSLYKVLKT